MDAIFIGIAVGVVGTLVAQKFLKMRKRKATQSGGTRQAPNNLPTQEDKKIQEI